MTQSNPYIVKENIGEAYTIREYVTGKPVSIEKMVPDDHGVYRKLNNLGFMMRDDGTTLGVAKDTTGFLKSDDAPKPNDGETAVAFATRERAYYVGISESSYIVNGKYYNFTGNTVSFDVISLQRDGEGNFSAVLRGYVRDTVPFDVRFHNITSDDYTYTGLVGTVFSVTDVRHLESGDSVVTMPVGSAVFAGIVGEGKLSMDIDGDIEYVTVKDDGLYKVGKKDGEPYQKICDYQVMYPRVCSNGYPHEGNGYSDTEVANWVEQKIGGVFNYGVHPSSEAGNLSDAGAFVNWFASSGQVDVSGGAGKNKVIVDGFGLGKGYSGSHSELTPDLEYVDPDSGKERPMVIFGYGTKYDAWESSVGKTALPLDWPFTNNPEYPHVHSDYATKDNENNITISRHGAVIDGVKYGAMEREGHGECTHCNGSGEIDGQTCEYCHGTGYDEGLTTYLMDRVHVCLFNDFTRADGNDAKHAVDTTVLKKTFINLATPIQTEDGESFEVTVSIPNVNLDKAWLGQDLVKNLSAYYAYVSQPRVYVLSGTWNFSDTKLSFKLESPTVVSFVDGAKFKIKEDKEDEDTEDEDNYLTEGDVRVTLRFNKYAKKFNVIGSLSDSGTKITLNVPLTGIPGALIGTTDPVGTICGAAYVVPNNDTLHTGTPLGLNNVRNADGNLGDDVDAGGDGLNQYNRFYGVTNDEPKRHQVVKLNDKRQIVATVYPTVTNTFQWNLTGRKKMRFLDRIMTGDADTGSESIYAAVAEMNREILKREEFNSIVNVNAIPADVYPLDMAFDRAYLRNTYGTFDTHYISAIGALLKYKVDDSTTQRPVTQAIRAAQMLADDFRLAKLKGGSIAIDSTISLNGSTSSDLSLDNEYNKMAYAIRLRHLPKVLTSAGTSDQDEPISEYLNAYPFTNQALEYYATGHYGPMYDYAGDYDTTDSTGDIGCDYVNNNTGRVYSINSAVRAATYMDWFNTPTAYEDLLRSAELAALDLSQLSNLAPVLHLPQGQRLDEDTYGVLEALDAFTKIASPDNIPVPDVGGVYPEVGVPEFIGADAYGYYRLTSGYTWPAGLSSVITTNLPETTDKGTAKFLRNYVAGYGAGLEVRSWDGYRVRINGSDTTSSVYYTRKKWYEDSCQTQLDGYISDAFLLSGSETSVDYNFNRLDFAEARDEYSNDVSIPPYCRDYRSRFPFFKTGETGVDSYIRVFMKFTFSADAGRWYCTDYRQAPVSYLTPLYGAKALEEKLDGKRIWVSSMCGNPSWKDVAGHTYGEYPPLDINPELVNKVMGVTEQENGKRRIALANMPLSGGGLGLCAPTDKAGSTGSSTIGGANFWNVRNHLRPATGASSHCNIPAYNGKDSEGHKDYAERDGIMADSVLWGQYDYPAKGEIEYHLPDVEIPDADLTTRRVVYANRNVAGYMMTGDIQVGNTGNTVLSASYGEGGE